MGSLTYQPLAALFPAMEGSSFNKLVEDIRAHGVREPITLYQGQILDGRNRYRAALEAKRDFPTRDFGGEDPLSFVLSQNVKRRHLDESQRPMIAARLANLRQGQRHVRVEGSIDLSTAATLLSVSEKSVKRAKTVQKEGAPELVAAVDSGQLAVSVAARAAKLAISEQRKVIECAQSSVAAKVIKQKLGSVRKAELAQKDLAPAVSQAQTQHQEHAPAAKAQATRQNDPDHLISQFATQVRSDGLEIMKHIAANYWPILVERLHEVIDEIELEAERWAREAHRPEEMPDISPFLRRSAK